MANTRGHAVRVRRTNCQLLLPGGATPEADRQPASTDRLERAGLVGVGNAHLFFVRGVHEPALNTKLTLTHKKVAGRMVILSTVERRTYDVRDVDTWDDHTEILSVESAALGAPDPAFKTETWTRIRQVKTGVRLPSGREETQEKRSPVEVSFVGERGDQIGDRTLEYAEVVAPIGELRAADGLTREGRGYFEVFNTVPDSRSGWERGLLRG